MYLVCLCICAVLFAVQFLFNQKFEKEYGATLTSAMLFSFYTSIFGFCTLFAANGFEMNFSYFSFFIALIYAVVGMIYMIASVKALEKVNLSAYSVFAMLGGMLLPSIYGLVFCSEKITATKTICYALIAVAMILEIDFRNKTGKKIYYAGVFVLNGLVGVLSVIHQSAESYPVTGSSSFLMLAKLQTVIICLMYLLKENKKQKKQEKALIYSLGFAIFSTIGNLLLLITLKHIPASVQYPVVTGGVMLVSLVISAVQRERITKKNLISTIIAFISTVFIAVQI